MFIKFIKFLGSLCTLLIPDFKSKEFEQLEYSKKYFPNDYNELKKLNIEEF